MTTDVVNSNIADMLGVSLARKECTVSDRSLTRAVSAAEAPSRKVRPAPVDLDVLDNHLGYHVRRAQLWIFQDFIGTLAAIDLRPAQYSVLAVIAANPRLSQSDVAEALGIERARLVRLLDRLEKRGLILRLVSPADRRSHELRLTREGQKTLRRAKALAALHEARLIAKLGRDRHRLVMNVLRGIDR
jgi:DNA-binding MarR family transcriptional regulator